MSNEKIIINRDILEKIYALAREGFPYEICGWLSGNPVNGLVTDIRPAKNVYNQKNHPVVNNRTLETAYVISPEDLLELNNEFDSSVPPLVLYHSHPNGQAYFSETDRIVATDPWGGGPSYPVQQLVIGINSEEVVEAKLFDWDVSELKFIQVEKFSGMKI